jgi:GNAT superfamily N-acetyltransferase
MNRAATFMDLPGLLDLGARMHAESPQFTHLAFSRAKLEQTLLALLDSPLGFIQVAERDGRIAGVMVAIATEHWCSDDLVLCELALYVEPEYRGTLIAAGLIKRFKGWKEQTGAKLATVGVSTAISDEMTEKTARLYEALGLKRFGIMLGA